MFVCFFKITAGSRILPIAPRSTLLVYVNKSEKKPRTDDKRIAAEEWDSKRILQKNGIAKG